MTSSLPANSNDNSSTAATRKPAVAQAKPKAPAKKLTQDELGELIKNKINALETERTKEEEEEEAFGTPLNVKSANIIVEKTIKKEASDFSHQIAQHSSQAEKITFLEGKYLELFQDHKRLEHEYATTKRKCDLVTKERDSGKSEFHKLNIQKQKLEAFCRELTKENKKLKEKEEAQVSPDGLEELVGKRVSILLEQLQHREEYYTALLKAKDMELKMMTAQLEEVNSADSDNVNLVKDLGNNVKREIAFFLERFSTIEASLRDRMEPMTNKILILEEKLSGMEGQIKTLTDELEKTTQAKVKLEQLCRVLQTEAKELRHANSID